MDIRDTDTIKKYNEAKALVAWYETEYAKVLRSSLSEEWRFIWQCRYEIMYRQSRLKESGSKLTGNHPYEKQIENRRRYIKEHLRKIYWKPRFVTTNKQ